jgi:hypothetical protein
MQLENAYVVDPNVRASPSYIYIHYEVHVEKSFIYFVVCSSSQTFDLLNKLITFDVSFLYRFKFIHIFINSKNGPNKL